MLMMMMEKGWDSEQRGGGRTRRVSSKVFLSICRHSLDTTRHTKLRGKRRNACFSLRSTSTRLANDAFSVFEWRRNSQETGWGRKQGRREGRRGSINGVYAEDVVGNYYSRKIESGWSECGSEKKRCCRNTNKHKIFTEDTKQNRRGFHVVTNFVDFDKFPFAWKICGFLKLTTWSP